MPTKKNILSWFLDFLKFSSFMTPIMDLGPAPGILLRTAPRPRHVARLHAVKGQAVASGLGSVTASSSHPHCLGKGRGISQALPGLAGIRATSLSFGFRPAHLERFVLMVRRQSQAKPKP